MCARGFCHQVAFYEDEQTFLETVLPFVRNGLEAGKSVLVAVRQDKIELLESELGRDATQVRFADMAELGRNPARIIPAWREFLDAGGDSDGGVHGIGEPIWPGRSEAELDECQRHESLLNLAFGDGPSWSLLCPYDSSRLDDAVLEAASKNHPYVRRNGADAPSAAWDGSSALATFAGALPPSPAAVWALAFGPEELSTARELVRAEARKAGMDEDRAADAVAAAAELVANSVRHGGGSGTLRAWRVPGTLVVEVEDRGRVEEPLAGRMRPSLRQEDGRGLWIANQLCDLVQIRSGADGTLVRLRIGLV